MTSAPSPGIPAPYSTEPTPDQPLEGRSIRILPGQYFDKETNTSYNHFRDYDPTIGRYVQPDPIGLLGGMNGYGYANQSPLSNGDLTGLETAVIHGGPTAGNPFGHVSIAFTGQGLYSFGTKETPLASSLVAFLNREASRRDSEVLILDTTPEQEQRMILELERLRDIPLPQPLRGEFGTLSDTCAVRTGAALSVAGIRSRFASSTSIYPVDIAFIAGQHAIRSYRIPRGSSVPDVLKSFDPAPYFP